MASPPQASRMRQCVDLRCLRHPQRPTSPGWTNDGGQMWALRPLPSNVGHLDTLSCPSVNFCAGLAASSNDSSKEPPTPRFSSPQTVDDVHRRAARDRRFDAVAQLQFGPGLHSHRMERQPRGAGQVRCGGISSNHRRRCDLVAWHDSGRPRRGVGLGAVVCLRWGTAG